MGVFVDGEGNIVVDGTITVYTYLSSAPTNPTTKATIYASDTGASTSTLGVVSSNSTTGIYELWIDDGDYSNTQIFTIVLSKATHVLQRYHHGVILTSGASKALDNLASVAINTSLISDTDVTDNLGSGDIRWKDTWFETLSSGLTAGDTLKLRGRDVDGAAYVDILTITSNNTVTADLHTSVTHNSNTILTDASTTSVLTSVGTLTSLTMGGTLALADNSITRPLLQDYAETATTVAASGATETLDITNGNVFDITLDQACTFTFSNPIASGNMTSFTLLLRQDGGGGNATTWPASVDWASGTAPTLVTTGSSLTILTFFTVDGGTIWHGMVGSSDSK